MLEIRLTPKLLNAVHMLKNIELNHVPSTLVAATALSREESSAVMNIFTTRQKEQKEPICNWW